MTREPVTCAACGAGDICGDCLGSGADPENLKASCLTCGGTGAEPPLLSSCSEERCADTLP